MNSRKSCPEEVSQLLVYQVSLINQYLVYLHGDFHRNKESTKNLANSTMRKKKNSVPIVDLSELLNACLKSGLRSTGTVLEPVSTTYSPRC